MSDFTPHPDDVTLAVEAVALDENTGIIDPVVIHAVLAAVGPALRNRTLREAAERIKCGPDCTMGDDCSYADASRALVEMAEGRWPGDRQVSS